MKQVFFFLASSLLILASCVKEDEQAGLEIQPDKNRLNALYVDLSDFTCYSSPDDAPSTNRAYTTTLLGTINDVNFGRSTAFIVTQCLLSTDNVSFGTNPQLLSAQLVLDIESVVGNEDVEHRFKIYKSNFDIASDSLYASNIDFTSYIGTPIADQSAKKDTLGNITIPLDSLFGQSILNMASTDLADNDAFINAFKGLFISVDTTGNQNGLLQMNFNSTTSSSYIQLEYIYGESTDRDTTTFKLKINSSADRFNLFYHNRTPLNSIFGSTSSPNLYLSGMGGVKSHIDLQPVFELLKDSGDLMIYTAELLLNAQASESYVMPTRLLMEIDDSDTGTKSYVDDYTAGTSNYGGYLNTDKTQYSLVVTRHIQNMINGNHQNYNLWFYPYGGATSASRAIISNGANGQKVILKIVYSKLN